MCMCRCLCDKWLDNQWMTSWCVAALTCEQRLLGDHCVSVCNLLALFRNWRWACRLWCSARTPPRDGRGIRARTRRESSRQPSGPSWTSWRWSNTDTLYVILQRRNRIGSQRRLWERSGFSLKGRSQYVQWNMNVLSIITLVSIEKRLRSDDCLCNQVCTVEGTYMHGSKWTKPRSSFVECAKCTQKLLLKGEVIQTRNFCQREVQFCA